MEKTEFEFHSAPWIPGTHAVYFGMQKAEVFVPLHDLADGIDQLLCGMQLKAESLGGNAYSSFDLTTDHNVERDGVRGVLLCAQGTVAKLTPRW